MLNIRPDAKPDKQKMPALRGLARRNHQLVEGLLRIGHIRRIQFSRWLANVVLVPKGNEKWRMCVHFSDLNKACPKDLYSLPRINQLVDSIAGYALLSRMDASRGYHQILLTWMTSRMLLSLCLRELIYCYTIMPFGLNNVGATYQRMVDQVFNGQLG